MQSSPTHLRRHPHLRQRALLPRHLALQPRQPLLHLARRVLVLRSQGAPLAGSHAHGAVQLRLQLGLGVLRGREMGGGDDVWTCMYA